MPEIGIPTPKKERATLALLGNSALEAERKRRLGTGTLLAEFSFDFTPINKSLQEMQSFDLQKFVQIVRTVNINVQETLHRRNLLKDNNSDEATDQKTGLNVYLDKWSSLYKQALSRALKERRLGDSRIKVGYMYPPGSIEYSTGMKQRLKFEFGENGYAADIDFDRLAQEFETPGDLTALIGTPDLVSPQRAVKHNRMQKV